MKNVNILITSCGRRVELVNCFKNALKGYNGAIIGADAQEDAPALKFVDKSFILPRINSDNYIEYLIELCNKEEISLIIPTIDTELPKLSLNREYIENNTKAKVLISSKECVDICRDKIKTADFLKKNGFSIPYTLTAEDIINQNYKFPLFIKPFNGSSSINAFKVNNEKELNFFLDYIENPILQECVDGTEYTVDVFMDFSGDIFSIVPRIRIQTRGGEILKGKIDMNSLIIEDVRRLMGVLKPIGQVTVQGFLGADNVFRYIEINARYGGGAPMSIISGADSPLWLIKLLNGENIDINNIRIENGAIFSRFDCSVRLK